MALIDTHTHLESFVRQGALNDILSRARDAGVEGMIAIGTSPDDWEMYRGVAAAHPAFVNYTVGLHPCSVDAEWESAFVQIENFWAADRPAATSNEESAGLATAPFPVAVGEIGLDRFHLPKELAEAKRIFGWQQRAFEEGLALAKRLACPVVVHSRGAFRECVETIDASGVDWSRVVFHCFTEGAAEMDELARRGGLGSFTGILTYKNADAVRAAAKSQGLARFMVETDAPYLTPMPHRGKPNEPAFVRHIAEFAAAHVFGVSFEELANASTANAGRFFGIK